MGLNFTRLERVVSTQYLKPSGPSSPRRTLYWNRPWGTSFWASANRTWDKVWGETEGQLSVTLEVSSAKMASPSNHPRFEQWYDRRSETLTDILSQYTLRLRNISRFQASCGLNPRLGQPHKHSLCLTVDFTDIELVRNPSEESLPIERNRSRPKAASEDGAAAKVIHGSVAIVSRS
jgi:hypothetical protein